MFDLPWVRSLSIRAFSYNTYYLIVMNTFAISVTLAGFIPVICFAQAHPSDDHLKSLLGAVAPRIFDIQSLTVRYSPMKEMSGTTLPDGSLQAICKVVANPMVLELTQPGFLREVPKLIMGSVR
jgi:hypothetical protein